MIDEQHLTAEIDPVAPEQDLPSLIARLDAIDEEMAEPLGELYALMDAQSEEDKEAFGTALDKQSQLLEQLPTDRESIMLGIDILQETGSPEIKEALEESAIALRSLLSEATALERVAEPLANKEFHETRNQFVEEAQWDSVIMKNISNGEYEGLYDLFSLCNSDLGGTPLDLDYARSLTNRIREWHQELAIQEDVLPAGEERQLPEGWQPTVELGSVMEDWEQSNVETLAYLSISRQKFAREALPKSKAKLSKLASLRGGIYLSDDPQGDNVPPQIAYGFERATEHIMAAFDREDDEYLRASVQDRPNMLFIGNQRLVKETTGIEDVDGWLRERIERHPDALTRGLGFVYFEDGIKKRDRNGDPVENGNDPVDKDEAWPQTGNMGADSNAISVDIRKKPAEFLLGKYPDAEDAVKRNIRKMIENTIDHELTHYAHYQRLPIAWLRRWHEVTKVERVNVTEYVEKMNSDNPANEGNPSLEDLADSSADYLNQPSKLFALAPMRFAVINERDGRYDPEHVDWLRSTLKEGPYSDLTMKMLEDSLQSNASGVIARRKAALAPSPLSFEVDTI